jgi:hypothetical protein
MPILSRRSTVMIGSVTALAAAAASAWFLLGRDLVTSATQLTIHRQHAGGVVRARLTLTTNVIPDFFEQMHPPEQRAEFHVYSTEPARIFVRATGVQLRTASGWQPYSEELRNEIWRLGPGTARDMFVEIPRKETDEIWRAYVRYGAEMHGPPLLKSQIREAWKLRSFANWTGKPWGGGRFSGQYELLSEEFSK